MQKHVLGCWKHDFDRMLLTCSKNMILNWIYGWTCWVTHWQPAQFRQVGSLPLNHTRVDGSWLFDNLDRQFGNVSVWTPKWTRSDGQELLLTLGATESSSWGKCLVGQKRHRNNPNTPVDITCAPTSVQVLPAIPWDKQCILILRKSNLRGSWEHWWLWRCAQDATRCRLYVGRFLSRWDLNAGLWATWKGVGTSTQRCRRHGAVCLPQWFVGLGSHTAYCQLHSSWLQSQDLLYHNMLSNIYLSLSKYLHNVSLAADSCQE